MAGPVTQGSRPLRSAAEIFLAFLVLGVRCFGGPVAHLGYFRTEFVQRRGWLDEGRFADIVGLCQFLPGPASSQTGVALGLMRGGYMGGMAAWVGFTLPSALLMLAFAFGAARMDAQPLGAGLLHGLKLAAVAIVAQAVWSMARTLCPDHLRRLIAVAAAAIILLAPVSVGQIAAIGMGAAAAWWLGRDRLPGVDRTAEIAWDMRVSRRAGMICLVVFAVLLLGLPPLAAVSPAIRRFDGFFRAGALVFGGGHVVLPLLHDAIVSPGWVPEDRFLAGYAAAQALPGPLFSFAAYLGAEMSAAPYRITSAALALVGIFLPGMLLLAGVLPFWDGLRTAPGARAAMRGANAATVGILAAALYDPLCTGSIFSGADALAAGVGFAGLTVWRWPPLLVVGLSGLSGICMALWNH